MSAAATQPRMHQLIMRRPKPIVPTPLVLLFAASLVFLVLYTALVSLLHSPSLYTHLDADGMQRNEQVIAYITGPLFAQDSLEFLDADERSHMRDVKAVFDGAFIIAIIASGIMLGIAIVFVSQRLWARLDELLGRSLRGAGWTILGIALFLVLASMLNFDRLWILFHAVFFPQGNWAFPAGSALLALYPIGFFERFVLRWLLSISAFGIAAIGLGYLLDRMRRHDELFSEKFEQKAHKEKQHKRK